MSERMELYPPQFFSFFRISQICRPGISKQFIVFLTYTHLCFLGLTLHEKCPYSELFWFVFSSIRQIQSISMYSVQMRENTDQNNSENGHFLRNVTLLKQVPEKKCTLLGKFKGPSETAMMSSIKYSFEDFYFASIGLTSLVKMKKERKKYTEWK